MKKSLSLILLGALLVGAFVGWRAYNSEERKIVRALEKLEGYLNWGANDGNFARLGRANALRDLLADEVMLEVQIARGDIRTIQGSDEIYSRMMAAQAAGFTLSVDIPGIKATVTGDNTATAELTLFLTVGNANREPFLQEIVMDLIKNEEGHWQISKVQTVRTLGG